MGGGGISVGSKQKITRVMPDGGYVVQVLVVLQFCSIPSKQHSKRSSVKAGAGGGAHGTRC